MQTNAALRRVAPALVFALAALVVGGMVAAITAHAPTQPATWASAYLVLVGGVATLGLALGRGFLSADHAPGSRLVGEFTVWLLGNALVLVGTLTEATIVVDVGGVLLAIALALVALGVRRGPGPGWLRALFVALVVFLLVSTLVGLVLAH